MATCGELVNAILDIIPKPEKETLIRNKMNQAIRFISTSGYFWRDTLETTIGSADGVVATARTQSIAITSSVRKLIYVKYPAETDLIRCLTLDELKNREECTHLQNTAYLSGSLLHIRNAKLTTEFNLAYYTSPVAFATDGTDDALSNWITEIAPGLVEDLTAAYVLNLIGDNEDAARISEFAALMRGTYIRDFMDSVGA